MHKRWRQKIQELFIDILDPIIWNDQYGFFKIVQYKLKLVWLVELWLDDLWDLMIHFSLDTVVDFKYDDAEYHICHDVPHELFIIPIDVKISNETKVTKLN